MELSESQLYDLYNQGNVSTQVREDMEELRTRVIKLEKLVEKLESRIRHERRA